MTNLSLGDLDDDLNFKYGADTAVYGSCGASLEGEMFVIGGWYRKRQVCIINQLKSGHLSADDNNYI